MNSLANDPKLAALSAQLAATPPSPASPVNTPTPTNGGGGPPVVPPEQNGGGGGENQGGRRFSLPYWVAMVIATLLVLFCVHKVVYSLNWNSPFQVSDSLDHQGAWYRQAALAPVDWVRSRQYYIEADFWGNKRVVYQVGDRRFVQTRSGQPAVEVYSAK